MKKIYSILICLLSAGFMQILAQTSLALDDFETVASSPNFNFVFSGGGYQTGATTSGNRPASVNYFATGTRSYQVNNGTATLTSPAISTTGNNFITFRLRVMAVSINTTNGLDVTDFIRVEISPDNGTNWWNTVEVTGFDNAYWGFGTGTGYANTPYDGNATTTTFSPVAGGNRTTDGYSTININNIPAVAQLRIRITMTNNSSNERWVIDNAQLIGTALAPLPVKFSNIKACEKASGVQIDWTSFTEVNVERYIIERSADGKTFSPVGNVAALNSSNEASYGFFDASPLNGLNFYRLRNLDFDGKSGFSNIVRIDLNKGNKDITVYPNPARRGSYLSYSSYLAKGNYTVGIFNAAGQQVFVQQFNHSGGAINQTIQLPATVRTGLHTLQLDSEGMKIAGKTFMVQ